MAALGEHDAVDVVNRLLNEGNIPLANYLVREALEGRPDSASLRYLLASIVAGIGRLGPAARMLQGILVSSPGFEAARRELESLEEEMRESSATSSAIADRFLLIRGWGFGFWSDVSHVIGQLLVADVTGRTPVVHWGMESRFSDGRGEAFRRFFRPVSNVRMEDLPMAVGDCFPPKWNRDTIVGPDLDKFEGEWSRMDAIYFLERPEAVLVSDFHTNVAGIIPWMPPGHPCHGRCPIEVTRRLVAAHLHPLPEVMERVDSFVQDRLEDRRWVSVHLRGSDKVRESAELGSINNEIMLATDQVIDRDPDVGVLLIADDSRLVESAAARWGDRLLVTEVHRTSSDVGVHYLTGLDPIALGREVLTDALTAARCDRFIGNGQSNVAAMIDCLKEWPDGACTLVRPSLFERPNTFLHFRARR